MNTRYFMPHSLMAKIQEIRKMQDDYVREMLVYDRRYKTIHKLTSCVPYGHLAMLAYIMAADQAIMLAMTNQWKEAEAVVNHCYSEYSIYWYDNALDMIEQGRLLPM